MTIEEVIKERDDWKSVALSFAKLAQGNVIIDLNSLHNTKNDFDVKEFMKIANTQGIHFVESGTSLVETIEILQKELGKDKSEGSYYHAWQCNIAMAFKDEHYRELLKGHRAEHVDIHKVANQAAKNFLDLLIKQK